MSKCIKHCSKCSSPCEDYGVWDDDFIAECEWAEELTGMGFEPIRDKVQRLRKRIPVDMNEKPNIPSWLMKPNNKGGI